MVRQSNSENNNSGEHKVLVIGLDSATMNVIKPWVEDGQLPNLARFFREGTCGLLESVPNVNSAPAWSSIATGKNPGKHGIFWFVEDKPEQYSFEYVNATFRREKTVWQLLSDAGFRVGVVNVPISYPADAINGFMIAGIDAPGINSDGCCHPPHLLSSLRQELGEYVIEPGIPSLLKAGRFDDAVEQLSFTIHQRLAYTKHLASEGAWDFLFVVFTSLDSAQHFFWKYMQPEQFKVDEEERDLYRSVILNVHKQLDEAIGELITLAGENATVMILSDHGMKATDCRIQVLPYWLEYLGYLKFQRGVLNDRSVRSITRRTIFEFLGLLYRQVDKRFTRETKLRLARMFPTLRRLVEVQNSYADIDWSATRAYSNGTRPEIWINLKGRQPQGIVEPGAEYDRLCEEIAAKLMSAQDPVTGESYVERVSRREELYSGKYVSKSPDLVVRWHRGGWIDNLRLGDKTAKEIKQFLSRTDPIISLGTGHHDPSGILLLKGPEIQAGRELQAAHLLDVTPTILYLMGQPVLRDMDGRVLTEAINPDCLARRPVTIVDPDDKDDIPHQPEHVFTPEDEAIVSERLRGLGYID
jgi:predicted AlkP superfamily phosphohydrolase/phosphomutase